MVNLKRDFSIMEEIRVELEENLSHLNLNVKDIFERVENDEFMLDVITLSIYNSIKDILEEKGIIDEEVEYKISMLNNFISMRLSQI